MLALKHASHMPSYDSTEVKKSSPHSAYRVLLLPAAAMMCPSDGGRTTFLHALMASIKFGTISGQVADNGVDKK